MSRRLAAATPRARRPRSERWARRPPTSTSEAFAPQGYGDDVRTVQQLWLAGDRDAARRRVPTAIGLGTNLVGTDDLVRERLRLSRDAGVTTLRAQLHGDPSAISRGTSPTGAELPARGLVVVLGPVLDPAGTWGLGVIEGETADDVPSPVTFPL
jgi:hypothetical protein